MSGKWSCLKTNYNLQFIFFLTVDKNILHKYSGKGGGKLLFVNIILRCYTVEMNID